MWASCDADIRVKIETLETENGFALYQKTFSYLQELEASYSSKAPSDLRFSPDNSSIDRVMPDTLSDVWRQDLAEKNLTSSKSNMKASAALLGI
jgi:hypothetical protein